ncbi:hypothetical protein BDW68DRAFT_195338 [Aspergillus falconensis]
MTLAACKHQADLDVILFVWLAGAYMHSPIKTQSTSAKITTYFQIRQVDPSGDGFANLIACEVASFDNPYQSIFRFLYPATLKNLTDPHRQWAGEDPDSIWLKAVDTENDNRIAAHDDGFSSWYPLGSRKEHINQCLALFYAPREKVMQRPHISSRLLHRLRTPVHHHHGIVNLLLEEQCRRADEFGLEAYLEVVTAMDVPIFMRHGLIPYRKVCVEPETTKAEEEGRVMERKMQPFRFWPMWRPKGEKFMPGETRPPWYGDLSAVFSKL